MRVIAYKNLTRGTWSVAELKGERGRGKLLSHHVTLTLANCQFHVSEASRVRMVRNQQREVHAWVIGDLVEQAPAAGVRVSYNPYKGPDFVRCDTGAAVTRAAFCHFTAADGVFATETV